MGNRIFEAKSQNDNKVEFTEFSPFIGICKNPGIPFSYHFCNFTKKMVIKAKKGTFLNFSVFSLIVPDGEFSAFKWRIFGFFEIVFDGHVFEVCRAKFRGHFR